MDIETIKKQLGSFTGEQRQGAIDAIKSILKGRSQSNSSGLGNRGQSNQPAIDIDPDLLVPTSGNKKSDYNKNDFDDPDDLLNKRKYHGNKGQEEQQNNSKSSNSNQNQKSDNKDTEKKRQPQIGDQGDPNSDLRKAEDAYRKANEYKEEAEQKAKEAEARGNSDEVAKQKEMADKATDLADKAADLADGDELTSKERARLQRIQDKLHDIDLQRKIENETEDAVLTDRETQREKELRKKQRENPLGIRSGGLVAFKQSIDKFIKDQVSAKRIPSWKRPNKRYPEETGIVMRGRARVENKNIPLLVVYFDQSGSWSNEDVQRGLAAIESLNYYVKQHKLKLEVYYFAVNIHDNPGAARREGGTLDAWVLVDDIKKKRPNNVVIMTDSDPGSRCASSVTVDGGVWLLFKNGNISRGLLDNVHGKKLTEVFAI